MIFVLFFFTSCSGGKDGKNGRDGLTVFPASDPGNNSVGDSLAVEFSGMVEIKELNSPNQKFLDIGQLDFGEKNKTNAMYNPQQIFKVKNSSDSSIPFSIELLSNEFFIEENNCPSPLVAHSSCDLKLRFGGAARRNGNIKGAIIFRRGPSRLIVLNLKGFLNIQGNDYDEDDDDDGATVISMLMDPGPFILGDNPLRLVTITNSGDDPLANLDLKISEGYKIFANGCPVVLEESEFCQVMIFYNDYSYLPLEDPLWGWLDVNSDMSDKYILSLTGGEVTSEDD